MNDRRRALFGFTVVLFFVLLSPSISYGHKDTWITIASNGKLKGLPALYDPAYLKVSHPAHSKTPAVVLELKGKVVHLPPCIARFFVLPKGEKITVTASWYHNSLTLPPYLHICLPQKSWSGLGADGYELLFNLQTAELISIKKTTCDPNNQSIREQTIDPSSICNAYEIRALWPQGRAQ